MFACGSNHAVHSSSLINLLSRKNLKGLIVQNVTKRLNLVLDIEVLEEACHDENSLTVVLASSDEKLLVENLEQFSCMTYVSFCMQ